MPAEHTHTTSGRRKYNAAQWATAAHHPCLCLWSFPGFQGGPTTDTFNAGQHASFPSWILPTDWHTFSPNRGGKGRTDPSRNPPENTGVRMWNLRPKYPDPYQHCPSPPLRQRNQLCGGSLGWTWDPGAKSQSSAARQCGRGGLENEEPMLLAGMARKQPKCLRTHNFWD